MEKLVETVSGVLTKTNNIKDYIKKHIKKIAEVFLFLKQKTNKKQT